MNRSLDTFESDLLTALRDEVEARAPRRGRSRRRLAATGAGVAAASAALVLVVPGLGVTPAYSVQEGNGGLVEVQVNRFEDADGLERALAEAGVPAEVNYVADGGECTRPGVTVVERRGISLSMGADLFAVTLAPATVRAGETLVIDASLVPVPPTEEGGIRSEEGVRIWVSAEVVAGDVGTCVPVEG